jgi:hypothetical protein
MSYLRELYRPWKLTSLAAGVGLLVVGARYVGAPDWDITFSVIQGLETYLTAAWSMRVLLDRRWRWVPLAGFVTWFVVDGSYWIYWSIVDPEALALMRDANFWASLPLYGICGVLWLWNGSLKDLARGAVAAWRAEVAA